MEKKVWEKPAARFIAAGTEEYMKKLEKIREEDPELAEFIEKNISHDLSNAAPRA